MNRDAKIYIAGHRGMVGSSIVRALRAKNFTNLVTRTSAELDLRNQKAVRDFFEQERPDFVYLAAAKVGGIIANRDFPVDFLLDNTLIAMNTIQAAADFGTKKLLNLGSSCIYPRMAPQPLAESSLLTGPLEITNEAYAIAKIAALKLTEYLNRSRGLPFISAMPCNLYGPGDNYHPNHSHVIPGLIRRFHEAKEAQVNEVVVWGTGEALREFLFVDDLADACFLLMEQYDDPQFINVGSGQEISIRGLANQIAKAVGFEGKIQFDTTKPDGTPRKVMDSSRIRSLSWAPKTSLVDGLKIAYQQFLTVGF